MDLAHYKDKLGIPGEGVHAARFFGYAIFDVIGTVILGLLFSILLGAPWYFIMDLSELNWYNQFIYWFFIMTFSIVTLFFYGILMHYLFSVKTTLNSQIFDYPTNLKKI